MLFSGLLFIGSKSYLISFLNLSRFFVEENRVDDGLGSGLLFSALTRELGEAIFSIFAASLVLLDKNVFFLAE